MIKAKVLSHTAEVLGAKLDPLQDQCLLFTDDKPQQTPSLTLLCIHIQFPEHHLPSPFPIVDKCILMIPQFTHKCAGLFLGSGLFHSPTCLNLCQYHTVLITGALCYVLKSVNMVHPTLSSRIL